jgi:hypothetical protein
MDKLDNKKLAERATKLKGKILTSYGSLRWVETEPHRFLYVGGITVPESMVYGGRAEMEASTDESNVITEVYLVA